MTDPTVDEAGKPSLAELAEMYEKMEPTLPKARMEEVDPERLAQVTRRFRAASIENLSPRREGLKELGDSVRTLIARLVATEAPDDVVAAATEDLRSVIDRFAEYDRTDRYGFGEAANMGDAEAPIFDQSPLIGIANPLAPPMTLHREEETIIGSVRFNQAYEGPPGCVHGGYVAAAFDEVLGATQSLSGAPGMTGTLSIRYEAPTPLDTDLRFEARITGVDGRKIFVSGECIANGTVTGRAEGIFISLQAGKFLRMLAEREARAEEHR